MFVIIPVIKTTFSLYMYKTFLFRYNNIMIDKQSVEQIANLTERVYEPLPLREHHLLSRQRYCDWQVGIEQIADSIEKISVRPLLLHTSEENYVSKAVW